MSIQRPRILVVDGDPHVQSVLGPALHAAGYEHIEADCGANGLTLIANYSSDAVILDNCLPDMEGQAFLRRARCFYEGPIIVLSVQDTEAEKIRVLDLGADDFVVKPFRVGELLARLRVATRNRPNRVATAPVVHAGECEIDLLNAVVKRAGAVVKLTPHEYELLARLVEGRGRVLTHQQLLTMIWGPDHASDVQYLRVYMGGLRRKLEPDPAAPRYLITEGGVGYRFIAD